MLKTDVLIIGAGVVGCAIARELSRYQVRVTVVDKNEDVGGDASKSNSAIIHTGYDATPGTLESELVVAANPMYDRLAADLDVPFHRIGAILPAVTQDQAERLPELEEKAFRNRVYDVEVLSAQQILKMEPALNPGVKGGLFIPRESIIDPLLLVVALAENAQQNGVDFLLNAEVTDLLTENGRVIGARTKAGDLRASHVVNCAALRCDDIARMVGKADYSVNPRKGQFFILDKNTGCKVNHIILPIPTKETKGKLITPTIHGNMLIGPTAEDLTDKRDTATTIEGLNNIMEEVRSLIPGVRFDDSIAQFSGLRPNRVPEGYHIDRYGDLPGFLSLSGIRSTGLTASAALAKYVLRELVAAGMPDVLKNDHESTRKATPSPRTMRDDERDVLIQRDPSFGRVVCRCETVTEGEILSVIRSPLPALTLDAVKRRLRVGMGRCQGGFCGPRMIEILARERAVPAENISKMGGGSYLITGRVR